MMRIGPLVLVGLPASGKTRVGTLLATRLGWSFIDTDRVVESQWGQSIPDIVELRGWDAFRRLEAAALADAVSRKDVVVATGGGIVEDASNRHLLKRTTVIWLRAGHGVLLARLAADRAARPLLEGLPDERLADLARRRDPLYAELAGHEVATDHLSTEGAAEAIMRVLNAENG